MNDKVDQLKGIVVSRETGLPVPGARITITNENTGFQAVAMSGSDGSYEFVQLPEGPYTIKFEAAGYDVKISSERLTWSAPERTKTGRWEKKSAVPADYFPEEQTTPQEAWVNFRKDAGGEVTDIVIGQDGEPKHDHYWHVNTSEPGQRKESTWDNGTKKHHKSDHRGGVKRDHRKLGG